MSTPRVAVVFGGGGAKAAAQLGAAIALAEAGITPVHWVGTSMGSVIAAAMASGADPAAMLEGFASLRARDVLVRRFSALLPGFRASAIFRAEPFRATVERLIIPRRFDDLVAPCTVTAVERETGQMISFGTGGETAPLIDALAASCALPPYFPPVQVNGRLFYDGGIREPLPLSVAETIDCDVVVAIDVGPGFDELGSRVITPPPFIMAADTAIGWLMAGTTQLLRQRWRDRPDLPKLIYVRPTTDRGATFAMDRIPDYGRAGSQAMRDALKEIG
jgi:NTE family protein